MKITPKIKQKVIDLREDGLSYGKIAKAVGISITSSRKIISEHSKFKTDPVLDGVLEAKILKTCPNPRIILVYFDDKRERFAKCVVRAGLNYPRDKKLTVKRVETSDEELYRVV